MTEWYEMLILALVYLLGGIVTLVVAKLYFDITD